MKIAVLAGDGIGPEIMEQALRVLERLALPGLELTSCDVGGAGYKAHGHPLPPATLAAAKAADAVLFGAVGDPDCDNLERALRPEQAATLVDLGLTIEDRLAANPRGVFLIGGHTDAVGAATFNLALSDRRAETVALALTEYFDVPPENMVVQGYGESDLAVRTLTAERANRRVAVRRITQLLGGAQ